MNSPPDFLPIIVDEPNGVIVILVAVIFYIADNDFSGVSGAINQKPLSWTHRDHALIKPADQTDSAHEEN